MERRIRTIGYLSLVAFGLGSAVFLTPSKSDGLAHVSMLDVGQGDSFLIQAANGAQLLIDGGADEQALYELSKVLPKGDKTIDVVLATHPDADHIGGLLPILEGYTVHLFLTSQVYADTEMNRSLYRIINEKNIPAYYVRYGMTLVLDEATKFSILFPDRDTSFWETNTASVVGKLQIGDRSILFTGDSPSSIESFLTSAIPKQLDVDIVKLGHHGSKTSSNMSFLRITTPKLALISAGKGNRYGHPSPEVIKRLEEVGIEYISTQDVGTYTVKTDGKRWYLK